MPGGRKRKKSEYVALFAEWERSGLSLSAFAQRKKIPYSTLAMWRRRLKGPAKRTPARQTSRRQRQTRGSASSNGSTPLLPVELALSSSPNGGSSRPFELVLRSGVVVRVPARFEAEDLRRLLQTLEAPAC